MSQFYGFMIGKVDSSNCQLREGDKLEVLIAKKSPLNREDIKHKGIIVYHDMSFCLKTEDVKTHPLTNYSFNCIFTKIN